MRFSALIYLISRVPVLIGVVLFVRTHPSDTLTSVALRQDGWWYTHLARLGYSASLHPPALTPAGYYHHRWSDWAFFPGYPLLIRGTHELTRLSALTSALIVASILGLTTVWAMYALGDAVGGVRVARGTALLFATWPGSAALSFPYSEGLFVTASAGCLLLLLKKRWLWAGVLGAIACFTRPTGIALLAAIAVAAIVQLVRRRDVRPLGALVLAASGGVAFILYGHARTGDALIWRHAENLWNQRLDYNRLTVHRTWVTLRDPLSALHQQSRQIQLLTAVLVILGLLMLLLMAAAFIRTRQWRWPTLVAYAAVTVGMIIAFSTVGTRPRMVLAVLPGFVWVAAWLPRRVTLALSGVFLLLLVLVAFAYSWQVTP